MLSSIINILILSSDIFHFAPVRAVGCNLKSRSPPFCIFEGFHKDIEFLLQIRGLGSTLIKSSVGSCLFYFTCDLAKPLAAQ